MKIYLENENKRKIVYDILNIFPIDFDFGEESWDIKIGDSQIYYKERTYGFETNADLKTTLYSLLVEKTGYESPWGTLTGSKPSKLLKKYSPSEIKAKYLVSDEKIDLLSEVYKSQEKLSFDKRDFSLYINIPFCPSRCDYCSYPTLIGAHHDKSEYVAYLLREIEGIDLPKNLDSIYIGGGTPSYLSASDIKRLLKAITDKFSFKEFTFEAGREDTLDSEKLNILSDYGVGRVSLNPQTFNRDILLGLNRDLCLDHFLRLYSKIKDLGMIVNMDFIIGLLNEGANDFKKNFKILEGLLPDNITFHSLAIKSGSKFREWGKSGRVKDSLSISKMIGDFTRENSYRPYYLYRQKNIVGNLENVGYERNNTAQRYNIIINEEIGSIIGLGMNANTKLINGSKYRNPRNLRDYYENFEKSLADKNEMIKNLREDI